MTKMWSNKPDAVSPAMALRFAIVNQRRRVSDLERSAMSKIKHAILLTAITLLMHCRSQAQSNVYSVAIYAGGVSYRVLCSFEFPFPPYHYKISERNWYEDARGLTIIDVGHEKARGGVLHRALDVECGSESFSVPVEPAPVKNAETKSPNHITAANRLGRFPFSDFGFFLASLVLDARRQAVAEFVRHHRAP